MIPNINAALKLNNGSQYVMLPI